MLRNGQKVEINYAGQLEDGSEFVNTWLMTDNIGVVIGDGSLLPALESELVTMDRGERRTVMIPCEKAYGAHLPEAVIEVPAAGFPHAAELPVGAFIEFELPEGRARAKVLGIKNGIIKFDCNHELAGHDLRFEIELVDDGTAFAMDQEKDATGCGCNKLRETLGESCCNHHHHAHQDNSC